MIWACPICREPLSQQGRGVVCSANHQFDRAKQGYLNLLPAHHRRSAAPGDDRDMLMRRREFLEAGFYRPLVDSIADELLGTGLVDGAALLDSGCGEGYYLRELVSTLARQGVRLNAYGIDISKEAAKLASKKLASGQPGQVASIAVASSFQLPVCDQSVDLLLRIFSPGDIQEVTRVLNVGGQFWRVVPGSHHLYEVKQALYDEVRLHQLPEVPQGFELIADVNTRFTMSLDSPESVAQLLHMTPFVWRGSVDGKARLQSRANMEVTAHFVLQKYRKVVPQ